MMVSSLVIIVMQNAEAPSVLRQSPSHCGCEADPQNYLIKLHEPWHHFDSNHWFHVAEYYLSRHRYVDSRMPSNASLYIVSADPTFAGGLTEVTFFLLQLAFTDGTTRKIDVFPPSNLQWQNPTVRSFRATAPLFSFDAQNPVGKKYVRHDSADLAGKEETCLCGKYLGEFGAAPIDRGYWFNGPRDVEQMRRKIHRLCETSKTIVNQYKDVYYRWIPKSQQEKFRQGELPKPRFKITLYQRDMDRKFLFFDEMLESLYKRLGDDWQFWVISHRDDLQPCLLNEALYDADMFLTTHGFQSTGVLFMKEGSVLFEAFPYKYWKEGYMHLAWEFGLHHRWVQMEEAVSWDR